MEQGAAGRRRVPTLDELRGFLIIYVVVYHLLYDLAVLFPGGVPWMFSDWMNGLRDFMTGTLIVISGISCHYSRNNLRRGLKTLGWGMALTVVTLIFMPSQLIIFGILHFYGVAMMLYHPLEQLLRKVPVWPGAAASLLLFFFTKNIYYGTVGLFGVTINVPSFFYNRLLLWPLGFQCRGVSSADYYPLLPWFFLFLLGALVGRAIKDGGFPRWFYQSHIPPLGWVGSRTLPIYLIHQPVLYGVLYLVFYVMG